VGGDQGRGGGYLAVGCTGCHGADFSGGKIEVGLPERSPEANLTPAGDPARWTEKEFIATVRIARHPDGRELSIVMPRAFGQMTDDELMAMRLYLQNRGAYGDRRSLARGVIPISLQSPARSFVRSIYCVTQQLCALCPLPHARRLRGRV